MAPAPARRPVDRHLGLPQRRPAPHIAWARALWTDLQSVSCGGGFINQLDADEGPHRVMAAYTPATWQRLVALKREYDPDNMFLLNQNIPPDRWQVTRRTVLQVHVSARRPPPVAAAKQRLEAAEPLTLKASSTSESTPSAEGHRHVFDGRGHLRHGAATSIVFGEVESARSVRPLPLNIAPVRGPAVFARWFAHAADNPVEGVVAADYAEHTRTEHSTFRCLLEPMLATAGFDIS